MEALRADRRVRFRGLSRTEAGIYPAPTILRHARRTDRTRVQEIGRRVGEFEEVDKKAEG